MAWAGLTILTIIAVVAYFIPPEWIDNLYPPHALNQVRNVLAIDKFDLIIIFILCKMIEFGLSPLRLLHLFRPPHDDGNDNP